VEHRILTVLRVFAGQVTLAQPSNFGCLGFETV